MKFFSIENLKFLQKGKKVNKQIDLSANSPKTSFQVDDHYFVERIGWQRNESTWNCNKWHKKWWAKLKSGFFWKANGMSVGACWRWSATRDGWDYFDANEKKKMMRRCGRRAEWRVLYRWSRFSWATKHARSFTSCLW